MMVGHLPNPQIAMGSNGDKDGGVVDGALELDESSLVSWESIIGTMMSYGRWTKPVKTDN